VLLPAGGLDDLARVAPFARFRSAITSAFLFQRSAAGFAVRFGAKARFDFEPFGFFALFRDLAEFLAFDSVTGAPAARSDSIVTLDICVSPGPGCGRHNSSLWFGRKQVNSASDYVEMAGLPLFYDGDKTTLPWAWPSSRLGLLHGLPTLERFFLFDDGCASAAGFAAASVTSDMAVLFDLRS